VNDDDSAEEVHMTRSTGGWRVLAIVLMLGSGAAGQGTSSAPFKAGFAERDITPEIGMEAPGGYGKAYHRTLHDPCKVRASVFDDGHGRVAIVGIDALGIRRDTVQKVRGAIEARTGIPAQSIMIGASHSHSSGPIVWIMPGEFDGASPLVQRLAYEESTCVDPKYLTRVEQALIDAVCEADSRRVSARAGVGKGSEPTVAFNRRFRMRDGRTVTHPGLGNPDIVEPAGPVDPDVGVIGAWDAKDPQRLLGCIVNFACHATTSPGGISANYIHYLEKVIQGYYGKECVVVFLAGASGDITQVDNRSSYKYPDGDRWAQLVGGKVGAEALKVLLTMERGTLAPVGARSRVWEIPRRVPSAERVTKSLEIVQRDKPGADPTTLTFAKETVLLDALIRKSPKVEVEVQVVQVGPAVFVTTPAEYFCRYGLEIKAASGFPFTFPVSLANGCVGYVPTEDAFSPHGGGYETRLTSYSNLEITAGTRMRDAGIELVRQLKPGPAPEPPRRPPFKGQPWSYGNVPPERE
jgi:neutral ceramidase